MKPLPHPQYDLALKRILSRASNGFLPLVLPGARWLGELATDLPATPRIVDLLWEVEYFLQRIIVHVELQTRPDDDIGLRIADYTVQIYRRYRLPVISIVVYLRPTAEIAASPFIIGIDTRQQLVCHYDIMRLWEVDANTLLGTDDPYLWPLAGLASEVTEASVQRTLMQIAESRLPRQEKGELVNLLTLLAGLRLPKAIVNHLLRSMPMIEDIWKESSYPEAVYDLGVEDGEKKGQQATMRLLALEVIKNRFPDLSTEILTRIAALTDSVTLRRLILQPNEIPDIAALVAILEAAEAVPPTE